MPTLFAFSVLLFVGSAVAVSAQSGDQQPTEAEKAVNRRRGEVLLRPMAITLRLAAMGREPRTTPPPYTVDDWMHFELFITQNSIEDLVIWNYLWPYREYRPELIRDGDPVPYTKYAEENLERVEREPPEGSMASSTLKPSREYLANYVKLEDWYDSPLKPGHYQLVVRKRFTLKGDWVESNSVTFDVAPRKTPNPIPDGFQVRLVVERPKEEQAAQAYRLGYNDGLVTELVNESDQRVYVSVIDQFYGHRPGLTKDGQVIPYSEEVTKLIDSKEKDARLVEVVNGFWLDPKTVQRLDGFSLKQWYGPLAPGIYHLTDRRRFEIGGYWTKDSAELIFEIIP